MTCIAIIPARSGSVSMPHKNVRLLGGKPLMAYAIEPAIKTGLFSHVIVSTDSREYAAVAARFGGETPFLRPPHLAEDVPTEWVIRHAVAECEHFYKEHYDPIVTLQCTTPLMRYSDIEKCVEAVLHVPNCDSSLTVREVREYPEWMMRPDGRFLKPIIPGPIASQRGVRQELLKTYIPNGACYATTRQLLDYQARIIGDKPVGVEMPLDRSIDIDSEEDFKRVEEILKCPK